MSGVFLVDSEVMFIPTQELTNCVNTIFEALGNPYFAEKADGVMLLAARNLLIEVIALPARTSQHVLRKHAATSAKVEIDGCLCRALVVLHAHFIGSSGPPVVGLLSPCGAEKKGAGEGGERAPRHPPAAQR